MLEYLGLADSVCRHFRHSAVEPNDLRQVAYLGLAKAIARFDTNTGQDIAAFAVPTIRGEIKQYLRDCTWAIRPPRALYDLSVTVTLTAAALAQSLGEQPGVGQLALATGRKHSSVREAMACERCRRLVSIDVPITQSNRRSEALEALLGETAGDYESVELDAMLREALRDLSDRQRRLVRLRFYDDLTQIEMARKLGVSQVQVSRELTRALMRLRASLEEVGVTEMPAA